MVDRFDDDPRFRERMTAATALAVLALVLALAASMVIRSGRSMKNLQNT